MFNEDDHISNVVKSSLSVTVTEPFNLASVVVPAIIVVWIAAVSKLSLSSITTEIAEESVKSNVVKSPLLLTVIAPFDALAPIVALVKLLLSSNLIDTKSPVNTTVSKSALDDKSIAGPFRSPAVVVSLGSKTPLAVKETISEAPLWVIATTLFEENVSTPANKVIAPS